MEREDYPAGRVTVPTDKLQGIAIGVVPTVVTAILVVLAAITLEPDVSAVPFIDAQSRTYFAVVTILACGLFAVGAVARFDPQRIPVQAAFAFLVTAAISLVIVDRVGTLTIVILVALAAAIAYSSHRQIESAQSGWPLVNAVLVLIVAWVAAAGLTSFQLQSIYSLPIAAAIAASGALVLAQGDIAKTTSIPLLGIIATVGAELKLALNFVLLDPFVSATLWTAGFGLTFALTYYVGMRVER